MVLDRYLTDVLISQFGHYVEGLDKNQVRLSALWKGQVSLQNVRLRKHALDHLMPNNPVEIEHGHVGTLQLHIPWQVVLQLWQGTNNNNNNNNNNNKQRAVTKKKKGGSVSLVLKDVHVLIVPRRKRTHRAETTLGTEREDVANKKSGEGGEEQTDRTAKNDGNKDPWVVMEQEVQAALDAELLLMAAASSVAPTTNNTTITTTKPQDQQSLSKADSKGAPASTNKSSSSSNSWQFWFQERLSAILENLTVTVQNIHVRYEDPGSCLGFVWEDSAVNRVNKYRPSFCVGLTLNQFTIHSVQQPPVPPTLAAAAASSVQEEKQKDASSVARNQPPKPPSSSATTTAPEPTPSPGFLTRYKRAAATDLALYWNSGTRIMSELRQESGEESFYVEAFLAFQNGGKVANESRKGLSKAVRTALFGLFEGNRDSVNTYVLDPFSPSITFAMVRPVPGPITASTASSQIPPSTMEARLPPCRITVSRNLIEDLGYVRKSFAIWVRARQYEEFQAIYNTRPHQSPLLNPAGWWKYALAAVLAVQRTEEERKQKQQEQQQQQKQEPLRRSLLRRGASDGRASSSSNNGHTFSHTRYGWHALSTAILLRGKYTRLYKDFINNDQDEYVHQQLFEMEREQLTRQEIVAFRIHVARQIPLSVPDPTEQISPRLRRLPSLQAGGGDDVSVTSALTVDTANTGGAKEAPSFDKVEEEDEAAVLSAEYRYRIFAETKLALAEARATSGLRGILGSSNDDDESSCASSSTANKANPVPFGVDSDRPFGLDNPENKLSWTALVSCPEVSLQVNDKRIQRRHRDVPAPVVRLEFAFLQEQRLYLDGSWELELSVGSLRVEDCTSSASKNPFPTLLGPKKTKEMPKPKPKPSSSSTELSDFFGTKKKPPSPPPMLPDSFSLDGVEHIRSACLRIRRSQRGYQKQELGSTTWTDVRVLPLEICYATAPAEALVRILNTANLDFANDYQRLGVQIYEWRERQKKRLLAALSRKQKSIFIEVTVGAPTLLLPDDDNLLIVDLGHLNFGNDETAKNLPDNYDDHWKFELERMQVQCSSVKKYKLWSLRASTSKPLSSDGNAPHMQQLIEPFSLIFSISTKFENKDGERTDSISVHASLPRLAFNFTTSAIRLVRSLREKWEKRQLEISSSLLLPSRVWGGLAGGGPGASVPYKLPLTRDIVFNFSAPHLYIRCENDVDGRDYPYSSTTPLVDLALRGIEGSFRSLTVPSGLIQVNSEAKLRGVDCIDLYQKAGEEFGLLMSSIAPESISYDRASDRFLNSTDLVIIKFESSVAPGGHNGSRLKIQFHELFVEWNAETIAAVHKAIKNPFDSVDTADDSESRGSEVFFDAEEEDFHDAGSVFTEGSDQTNSLSEIQSSRPSSFVNLVELTSMDSRLVLGTGGGFGNSPLVPLSQSQPWLSGLSSPRRSPSPIAEISRPPPLEIFFDLSKLRVNFNKESRHRRVVSAEMDRTAVVFSMRPKGGYVANVNLGNFTLSDADSVDNKTLYREIVGLKTDMPLGRGKPASLLEMSIVKNPRSRRYVSGEIPAHLTADGNEESVTIDVSNPNIRGCDIFFSAQFSPMRFVYLQQLWFEVIDYFFEGITGYEVWGNRRPAPVPESQLTFAPLNADEFSFTRFEVSLESPVILVPVSYCSTDFLRVETDGITVGNRYDVQALRTETPESKSGDSKQQWFNNCTIKVGEMTLSSWSGRRLNSTDDKFTAHVEMNWPSGPTAILNKPKWKVDCRLDQVQLSLLQEDYALIQHIAASNFSEGSRHWEEWDALQALPPMVLERYKEDIMVHFGYDKKDVIPTTFDVLLTLPSIVVSLLSTNRSETALVRCFDLTWKYWKHSDLISRQHILCHIEMERKGEALLSGQDSGLNGEFCEATRPTLGYKSTSRPHGEIERSLDMEHSLIHVGYAAWDAVADFFRDLPSPTFISPEHVIQVGDRWYKIGGRTALHEKPKSHRNLSWITAKKTRSDTPSQQEQSSGVVRSTLFRAALRCPHIALESGNSAVTFSMDNVEYISSERLSKIEKDFRATNMKLAASCREEDKGQDQVSILELAFLSAKNTNCSSGYNCSCGIHSTVVEVGAIKSTLLYSDLNIACDVISNISRDVRIIGQKVKKTSQDGIIKISDVGLCPSTDYILEVSCASLNAMLSDNSKRHFAESQELISISLSSISFYRRLALKIGSPRRWEESTSLSVIRVECLDNLQMEGSPFKSVFTAFSQADAHSSFFPQQSRDGGPCAILFGSSVDDDESRYTIDVHTLGVQYNPSMVLAFQRLLGRLRKRFLAACDRLPPLNTGSSHTVPSGSSSQSSKKITVSARLRSLSLFLNKELQGRSLVQVTVEDSRLNGHKSKSEFGATVNVEDLRILDSDFPPVTGITDPNKLLLRVSERSGPFVEVKYLSFVGPEDSRSIPDWCSSFIRDEKVDSVVDFSLASLEFILLFQRTLELLDYVRNALPGKSMGSTGVGSPSPATQKIPKRTYSSFRTGGIKVYVPRNANEECGVVVMGDFLVRGWTSPNPLAEVEGSITDLCCKVYGENGGGLEGNKLIENIEVLLHIKKSADGRTEVKCGISDVQARLYYTDYVQLMAVIRDNVGRPIDRSNWDHLDGWEKYDDERAGANVGGARTGWENDSSYSKSIEYGPSPRIVRFGHATPGTQNNNSSGTSMEVTFAMSDMAVILRRNDDSSESEYDMVLFRGEQFDFVWTRSSEGEAAVFSVQRIFVFDLGEQGRVLRSTRSYSAMDVGPMPIPVLVEGYSSHDKADRKPEEEEGILIMARLDKPKNTSEAINMSIVVSRLSVAALFRPLQELADFLGLAWSEPPNMSFEELNQNVYSQDKETLSKAPGRPFALRLVLHYPRIIFVADEGDPHSRALILRGLALVNASIGDTEERPGHDDVGNMALSIMSVNGDFQGISSYIIPDVSNILFAKDNFRMHIEDVLLETSPFMFLEDSATTEGTAEEPGISLLLPVTVGVEFEQRSKNSAPYQRSVALNMDPVSLMLSAEDLQLIRLLARKWSSGKGRGGAGTNQYVITFHSARLGLGLRKVGGKIIVDAVHKQPIGIGDTLVAINDEQLLITESSPLSDVVERLRNEPRPLNLTFCVGEATGEGVLVSHFEEARRERKDGYKESADISLAQASLTLIGNDVPIFRGVVSTTRVNLGRKDGQSLERQLTFSAVLAIDYYNLKIWGWEPFMEASNLKLLADMSDPLKGSKNLTIEASDGGGAPISFNLTDACVSAARKLSEWDTSPEYETIDGTLFVEEAKKAANAALRFAKQQKNNGSKPFLLLNQSGIACAFVIQKRSSPPQSGSEHNRRGSFVTVGDYSGLQYYDPADVSEVPSGGECKFRLDRGSGSRQKDGQGRVPCLTVAFQTVSGITLEPLVDLQIVCAGVTLLPMICQHEGGYKTVWVSWTVDPREEMTVLMLSSTFRIVSLLNTQLELGLEPQEPGVPVRSLGALPSNNEFYLPLWLCLQSSFELSIRPVGGIGFSPLFSFGESLSGASEECSQTKYVECHSRDGGSVWLAASKNGDSAATTITIDCELTLLNMLPIDIDWEVSKSRDLDGNAMDSSTQRQALLRSGKSAEILGADDLDMYVRIKMGQEWSSWLCLEARTTKVEEVRVVSFTDIFGVPFHVGARVTRKAVGFRVVLFAELWFLNATPHEIAFGVSAEYMKERETVSQDDGQDDFSVAEAALKEFSSLFESGDAGRNIRNQHEYAGRATNMLLLPSNKGTIVVEECFEYIEVERTKVVRRWWASSDPLSSMPNLTLFEEHGDDWSWIDPIWAVDCCGLTSDGWETAPDIFSFSPKRLFHPSHPYRRRRWHRRRRIPANTVNAFFQRPHGHKFSNDDEENDRKDKKKKEKKDQKKKLQLGIQVNGGQWSLLSQLPVEGMLHGAIRAPSCRWPQATSRPYSTYELCYSLTPLEGEWGEMSRLLTISSRFIVRNDSKNLIFEVKQAGAEDNSASVVQIGGTVSFHWFNQHLPELICIRPCVERNGQPYYRWSGGFDPLSIGVIPLRIRKSNIRIDDAGGSYETRIRSVKLESKIRPGTGRTGINLSFEEEDERADGCLFRIDNRSLFPVWVSQDGILLNPSQRESSEDMAAGDFLPPNRSISFALDVPFRQGKYKHRKASTLEELLRVRIALGPLHSRCGIESIRVVSLSAIGSTVRLNPSKLPVLDQKHREALQQIRVIGVVTNDGPTRALRLVMMRKEEALFSMPFSDDSSIGTQSWVDHELSDVAIIESAEAAIDAFAASSGTAFPLQEDALRMAVNAFVANYSAPKALPDKTGRNISCGKGDDDEDQGILISFRMAFNGFIFSLVDSSPAEIAVVTLKNVNTLASWNTKRTFDSTIYVTVAHFQVDNMLPNSPYPVAISPDEQKSEDDESGPEKNGTTPPLLVLGFSFGPRHKSGITILKSVTVAPRNLAIRVDLAFLVRLQKYVLDLQRHFSTQGTRTSELTFPDMRKVVDALDKEVLSGVNSQRFYFGGLTILPCAIKLSVAPARALTPQQALLEGEESAAIHRAVRKGDVRLGSSEAFFGVKIGSRNATPLAVMRGVVKSIVVDALLRLDGASLTFAGVSLQNHIATSQQLGSILTAHYLASLKHNVPALVGSMSALGNPVGLVRGLGDGVSDFVLEPVKGFQRSVQEMDASHLVDGVARGTLSLARHTVGGFADSAAALAETFSKNMTVLTLDRRYAQKRDRGENLREMTDLNVALGLGSGFQKLAHGFLEGVTGVVRAPIRGAEKKGFEGFAKGLGKGLLGLLVKPIIGISDGITDVMIGVKGAMDGTVDAPVLAQIRPRRALYGRERAIRPFSMADAAASALMMRTRLAGELYMSHVDMGDRVALFSVRRLLMLGPGGQELLVLKYKHIERWDIRPITLADGGPGWGIIIILNTPRRNGSEVEVINCKDRFLADEMVAHLESGKRLVSSDLEIQEETGELASPDFSRND